jgi:hypothetical protein
VCVCVYALCTSRGCVESYTEENIYEVVVKGLKMHT